MTNELEKVPKSCLLGVTSSISLQFVRPLAEYLCVRGWKVDVVASFDNGDSPLKNLLWKEHHLKIARSPNPLGDFESLVRLSSFLRRLAPDVVVFGTPKAALLGLVAAKICGVRHRILILHGLRSETGTIFAKFFLGFFENVSSSVATAIISVSHSLRKKYIENGHASPTKVHVLGRGSAVGVEMDRPTPIGKANQSEKNRDQTLLELGLDPSKTTFAYVGRIAHDKGISYLIEALKVLECEGHSMQFLFVGENEDRDLLELLVSHDSWRVIPWTANIDLIYASIDALCLPSLREGMPTVVLEAATAGLPTIGARSTGIVDLIDHEKTGLLVEPEDSESLARAILRLAQNPKLREDLGRNARHYVARHFAQDQVLMRYHRYLEGLLIGSTREANLHRSTSKKR